MPVTGKVCSIGQRSRSLGSNVPEKILINGFIMPWPTLLKHGPHIRPG